MAVMYKKEFKMTMSDVQQIPKHWLKSMNTLVAVPKKFSDVPPTLNDAGACSRASLRLLELNF